MLMLLFAKIFGSSSQETDRHQNMFYLARKLTLLLLYSMLTPFKEHLHYGYTPIYSSRRRHDSSLYTHYHDALSRQAIGLPRYPRLYPKPPCFSNS